MSRLKAAHVKRSHMRETPKSLESQSGKISRIGRSAGKIEETVRLKIPRDLTLRDFMHALGGDYLTVLCKKSKVKSIRNIMVALLIGLEIALPSASAVGANAFAEGQAFVYASGGAYQPVETRRANRTQIFIKTWKVSGTIEGVGKYGRDSEWALRKLHAMNFVPLGSNSKERIGRIRWNLN